VTSAAAPVSPSRAAPTFDPSTFSPPKIPYSTLKKLYSYDAHSFLDAVLTDSRTGDGVGIEVITYSDTRGGTIPAYVVTPQPAKGRMPGVVYAHAAGADRDTWLPELSAIARHGVTAMVAEVPFKVTGDPNTDSAMVIAAVLAQRRALDLLARRDDTDPSRLAVVGHGWGGDLAQVLTALEPRLSGVVLAGTGSRLSQTMVVSTQVANRDAYLGALTRFDGARYVSVTGTKRSVLMQFGAPDAAAPKSQVDELVAVTAGSKARKNYPTGDDLVKSPAAVADRWAFVGKVLRVK
jgi:cephalosporin-C deacetylase-like acetyl esterase